MRQRRGIVLAAVTVVAAASLWTTVALLARAGIETAGIDGGSEAIQDNAAVHSAVLVVASELFGQRDEMRVGQTPQLDEQIVLWESGRHSMIARLMAVDGEQVLAAEAGRLDLNLASAEQLERVLGESESVIAARTSRRFDDVRDALSLLDQSSVAATEQGGLCERLTVHGHEPNVQQSGDRRINISVPWSEVLASRIRSRFDDNTARVLEEVLKENPVETDADLMRLILAFSVAPADWPDALDAFSMEPVQYRRGRIDINAASAEVIASLPGVTTEQAASIVQRRDDLDDDLLATRAWPFIEQLLPTEIAVDFLDRTTVGSWTWRLRLACGEIPGDDLEADIQDARVVEVIIDVAGPQPRIAMLRDVTMRPHAIAWRGTLEESAETPVAEDVQADTPEGAPSPESSAVVDESEGDEADDQRLGRWQP